MALLDIFKKNRKKEKKEDKKIEKNKAKKENKPLDIQKTGKEIRIVPTPSRIHDEVGKPQKIKKGTPEMAYRVLLFPNITEKATFLTKENKYVFRVHPRTNKKEIKQVIEDMYGVDVVSVNIINIPAKKKKFKGRIGWKKGYKKAVIEIKEGQKIEVLPR